MKIKSVKIWSEDLELSRPYTISYETIDSVENVFVHIQLEDGTWGIGAGSPAEFVTGEDIVSCVTALENNSEELLIDKNINSKPNVLLMHGDKDEIVPVSSLLEAKEFFNKIDYKIQTKIFKNCEHRIPQEGSSMGLEFLKTNLY